ncbi:hypothetical protein HDU76_003174, partial [Blyttiomyces sp. JEL0837]
MNDPGTPIPQNFNTAHTLSTCGYIGISVTSNQVTWGHVVQYSNVVSWVVRVGLGISFLVKGVLAFEGEKAADRKVRWMNTSLSLATLVTGVASITYTLQVFCPHVAFTKETYPLPFYPWFYFISFATILIYVSSLEYDQEEITKYDPESTTIIRRLLAKVESDFYADAALSTSPRSPNYYHQKTTRDFLNTGNTIVSTSSLNSSSATSSSGTLSKQRVPGLGPGLGKSSSSRAGSSLGSQNSNANARYPNQRSGSLMARSLTASDSEATLFEDSSDNGIREDMFSPSTRDMIFGASRRGYSIGGDSNSNTRSLGGYSRRHQGVDPRVKANEDLELHGPHLLWADILGYICGLGSIVGHAFNLMGQSGPYTSMPYVLLQVFSTVIISQVGLGAFNPPSGRVAYMKRILALLFAHVIIGAICGGIYSNTMGFFVSFGLWPLGVFLCLSATGRIEYDRLSRLLESARVPKVGRRRSKKGKVGGEGEGAASPTSRSKPMGKVVEEKFKRHKAIPIWSMRLLRSLNVTLIVGAVTISIVVGTMLPIAIAICMFSLSSIAGVVKNVGRPVGLVSLTVFNAVIVVVLLVIALLPNVAFPRGANIGTGDFQALLLVNGETTHAYVSNMQNTGGFGFYIDKEFDVTTKSNLSMDLYRVVAETGGVIYWEIDHEESRFGLIAKSICSFAENILVGFVAVNLQTIFKVKALGLLPSSLAYFQKVGTLVEKDFSFNTTTDVYTFDGAPIETFLMNPWLAYASRRRERRFLSRGLTENDETPASDLGLLLSGATHIAVKDVSLALRQAGENASWAPSFKTPTALNFNITTVNVNYTQISTWSQSALSDVPFAVRWGFACGGPVLAVILIGITTFMQRKLKRERKKKASEAVTSEKISSDEIQRAISPRGDVLLSSPIRGGDVFSAKSATGGGLPSPVFAASPIVQRESVTAPGDKSMLEEDVEATMKRTTGPQRDSSDHIKVRKGLARLAECVALCAWILFVVTVGIDTDRQQNQQISFRGPTVFIFIFGITGFASFASSIAAASKNSSPAIATLAAILLALATLSTGAITDRIAYYGPPSVLLRLVLTGAGLFGGVKSVAAGMGAFRHSRVSLEMENLILGTTMIASAGWMCVAVALGRLRLETGITLSLGIGPYGAVACGAVASVFMISSALVNSPALVGLAAAFATAAIFFTGGLLGQVGPSCFNNQCSWHEKLMLSGGVMILVSLTIALAIRSLNLETEEQKHQRLLLRYQVKKNRKLQRKLGKVKGGGYATRSIESPTDIHDEVFKDPFFLPFTDSAFTSLTVRKSHWLLWRVAAAVAIFFWVVFLGSFGALTGLYDEIIICGIVFAVCAPIAIGACILALAQDSRLLAVIFSIFALLAFGGLGGVLNSTADMINSNRSYFTPGSATAAFGGSFVFMVITTAISSAMVSHLNYGMDKFLPYLFHGVCAVLSWLILTIGVALWITKNQTSLVVSISTIAASILAAIACALQGDYLVLELMFRLSYFESFDLVSMI